MAAGWGRVWTLGWTRAWGGASRPDLGARGRVPSGRRVPGQLFPQPSKVDSARRGKRTLHRPSQWGLSCFLGRIRSYQLLFTRGEFSFSHSPA